MIVGPALPDVKPITSPERERREAVSVACAPGWYFLCTTRLEVFDNHGRRGFRCRFGEWLGIDTNRQCPHSTGDGGECGCRTAIRGERDERGAQINRTENPQIIDCSNGGVGGTDEGQRSEAGAHRRIGRGEEYGKEELQLAWEAGGQW